MTKVNLKKVWKIYKDIIKQDLIDDRREYDTEDLESAYRITSSEAKFLFKLIKRHAEKED